MDGAASAIQTLVLRLKSTGRVTQQDLHHIRLPVSQDGSDN